MTTSKFAPACLEIIAYTKLKQMILSSKLKSIANSQYFEKLM